MNASPPIYIVYGFPHSGTSAMMRCLEFGGIPCACDPQQPIPNWRDHRQYIANPYGFYELSNLHAVDWPSLRGKAVKIVNGDVGFLPKGETYHAILMLRDEKELVEANGGNPDHRDEVESFRARYERGIFADMKRLLSLGSSVTAILFSELIRDPLGQMSRLKHLPIDTMKAASAIDPSLYRHRRES